MAVSNVDPVTFSLDGQFLAHSSPAGTIKIWETSTGKLKQEYTPSSHLSATCTCLSWAPKRRISERENSPKRKKRKSDPSASEGPDLLALGTTSGTVLLYSLIEADLHTQLKGGHSDRVNGVCWNKARSLYSCSDDATVVHWNVKKSAVVHQWKTGSSPVYSICVCSSGKHLLTASRKIQLWDLDTYTCLKKFTGHATEVFRLIHIPTPNTGPDDDVTNTYFLSAAISDRLINAWQIGESKNKHSVASFSLPDEPVYLDIAAPTALEQSIIVTVVTKSGKVLLYEHVLNGRLKQPLKPKVSIQIVTDDSKPKPICVLCTQLNRQKKTSLHLAHGHFLKPTFERLSYASLDAETCLIRRDPTKTVTSVEKSVSIVKTPGVSKDVTVLAPEMLAPSKPTQSERRLESKRKKSQSEMSIEERVNVSTTEKTDKIIAAPNQPTADSLATLLAQGLQSNDHIMLNNVLQRKDVRLIRNTIKRLPVPCIVPLVQHLTVRMQSHANLGGTLLIWVKEVLTLHTSYLMTFPELVEALGNLYQIMDTRISVFGKLSRLQGKLGLILSQIASQGPESEEEVADKAAAPLMVYQDESDSEEYGAHDSMSDISVNDWEGSDMDVESVSSSEEAIEITDSEHDDDEQG